MAVERHYFAAAERVFCRKPDAVNFKIAEAVSRRYAKRIANALNLYRPKVRRSKPAEKAV